MLLTAPHGASPGSCRSPAVPILVPILLPFLMAISISLPTPLPCPSLSPPTSPEPSDALLPADGAIGVHGAAVAAGAVRQGPAGLEPDLDHVRGLGTGHGHSPRGAASQETRGHACAWRGQVLGPPALQGPQGQWPEGHLRGLCPPG